MTHTELESRPVAESPLTGTPQISVVIPVYNEAATIEEVLRRTVEVLESLARPYEVIVVDDGSSDGTWSIVERAHAREPRLRARSLQAQLRAASGDARRPRPLARRHRRDHGR